MVVIVITIIKVPTQANSKIGNKKEQNYINWCKYSIIVRRACMATMGILYYRLAQRGLGKEMPDDEQQWFIIQGCIEIWVTIFISLNMQIVCAAVPGGSAASCFCSVPASHGYVACFSESHKYIILVNFHFTVCWSIMLHNLHSSFFLSFLLTILCCWIGESGLRQDSFSELGVLVIIYFQSISLQHMKWVQRPITKPLAKEHESKYSYYTKTRHGEPTRLT